MEAQHDISRAVQLLGSLDRRGIRLSLHGERIRYQSPLGQVSAADRSAITELRDPLIHLLSDDSRAVTRWERQWLSWESSGAVDGVYNFGVGAIVDGLDVDAMEQALMECVSRHESLRTRFIGPAESCHREILVRYPMSPLSREPAPWGDAGPTEQELRRYVTDWKRQPFAADSGQLLRASAVSISPGRHLLVLAVSHLALDGCSSRVLSEELMRLYDAGIRQCDLQLEAPVQFGDYVSWLQRERCAARFQRSIRFWDDRLAGAAPLEFPQTRSTDSGPGYRLGARVWQCPDSGYLRLLECARRLGTTPAIVLRAVIRIVLWRWCERSDLLTHSLTVGRPERRFDKVVGLFRGTLALRVDLSGSRSFADLVKQIHEVFAEAQQNETAFQFAVRNDAAINQLFVENFFVETQERPVRTPDKQAGTWQHVPLLFHATAMPSPAIMNVMMTPVRLKIVFCHALNLIRPEVADEFLARVADILLICCEHPDTLLNVVAARAAPSGQP